MVINSILNPVFALILFVTGIWLGSMINPFFGLISILGGLLLGFSNFFKNGVEMNKQSKVLLYASFVFLLSLMLLAYLTISGFYLYLLMY
ncbi:hypothetical protein [Bacillus marasmi]|uniref:hypothetical protein n=1 Tax=Bacillus marasmi TaxID=1926279 RepID=UPI0011CA1277|nr:hypothetical protein [Bacillus marasmi]